MPKEIIIIAGIAKNHVIGKNNKLPWNIKEDLKHFKKLTLNHPIIMGRKTFLSLPIKPLSQRENIVLSRSNFQFKNAKITIKKSLEEALEYTKNKKIYIIGGESVYKEAMKIATKLEITLIHNEYEGDVFFPEIDFKKWELIKSEEYEKFTFLTYLRVDKLPI